MSDNVVIAFFPVLGAVSVAIVGYFTTRASKASDDSAKASALKAGGYALALEASKETIEILQSEVEILKKQRVTDAERCDERIDHLQGQIEEATEAARAWTLLQREYESKLQLEKEKDAND